MAAAALAGFVDLENAAMGRGFAGIFALRLLGIPLFGWVGVRHWMATGRGALHLAGLVAVLTGMAALAVTLKVLQRRGMARALHLRLLVGSDVVVLAMTCALSGGMASPFVYLLPLIAAMNGIIAERRQAVAAGLVELAILPLLFWIDGSRPALRTGMLAFAIVMGMGAGRVVRRMFEQMTRRALQARDDVLRLHGEQLQALTMLSGEIAHELKTPLASIKGLTGLALMELQEPSRAAERLEVLRHEVSRMQKILEEFLNFSRPLSPLVVQELDACELAREVGELFQGLSRERRIAVRASGARALVRCDPRKIKQLLINLVQNAFEASAPGGEIALEVEPRPSGAALRVLDRGHGLPAEVGQRVFEAGVTTKARGSGLGLTISRMLAQQHGGALTLAPREGGGCVAELVLPGRDAPVQQEGRAA